MAPDPVYNERLRLCRELHDGAVQDIIAALLTLRAMPVAEQEAALPHREAALRAVERALEGARRLIREVRNADGSRAPRGARTEALAGLIRRYVGPVAQSGGIRLRVRVDPGISVPSAHAEEVGSILQEAARNAVRHASAHTLHVTATRASRSISIELRDDGVGFATLDPLDGFGIVGMAERAALVGGSLVVNSCTGVGTRLSLTLPLAECSPVHGTPFARGMARPASGPPPPTRLVA